MLMTYFHYESPLNCFEKRDFTYLCVSIENFNPLGGDKEVHLGQRLCVPFRVL